jgi:hypothetical protein
MHDPDPIQGPPEPPEDDGPAEGEIVSPLLGPVSTAAPYGYGRNGRPRGRRGCTAHTRSGQVCPNPAVSHADVCRMHGGSAPQVIANARRYYVDAAADAANTLIALMGSANPEVARRAAVDVARLAGMEPGRTLTPGELDEQHSDAEGDAYDVAIAGWLERRVQAELTARDRAADAAEQDGTEQDIGT